MKKILIPIFLLLITGSSYAQTYFDDGVSGFSIYGAAAESYWDNYYDLSAFYTFSGRLDVGVRLFNRNYNVKHIEATGVDFFEDPSQNGLQLEALYYLFRSQVNEKKWLNAGLWANYEIGKNSGTSYTAGGILYEDLSENTWSAGLVLSSEIKLTDKWQLQPYAWTGFGIGTSKFNEDGRELNENFRGTMAALGVQFERVFINGNRFWVGNEFYTNSFDQGNETTLQLSAGYNFAFKTK